MNKLFTLLFVFITILSIVSCRQNAYETLSPDIGLPAFSPKTVTSDAAVLFIGNSLTYASQIPEKLSAIALVKNCGITVHEVTLPGYALSQHLDDFKSKEFLKSYIDDADIIILQEWGMYRSDTVKTIQGFQDLGGEKEYYFLETEFDNFYSGEKEKLEDITFIRTGSVHDQLIKNHTFKYADLHLPDDSHPNDLYGYLAAFTVFCKINNICCSDYFTADEMIPIIGEHSVQGVTAELESDAIVKIQAAVDAALEEE